MLFHKSRSSQIHLQIFAWLSHCPVSNCRKFFANDYKMPHTVVSHGTSAAALASAALAGAVVGAAASSLSTPNIVTVASAPTVIQTEPAQIIYANPAPEPVQVVYTTPTPTTVYVTPQPVRVVSPLVRRVIHPGPVHHGPGVVHHPGRGGSRSPVVHRRWKPRNRLCALSADENNLFTLRHPLDPEKLFLFFGDALCWYCQLNTFCKATDVEKIDNKMVVHVRSDIFE